MFGENLIIKIIFINKVVINEGLRFIMREGKLIIGVGVILLIIE